MAPGPRDPIPTLTVVSERPALTEVGETESQDPKVAASSDIDWAILMAKTQTGDGASYRRLLLEVTPYLRAIVGRSHCDRNDVEDVIQDILLTVHSIRYTYDPARPFAPWLASIANRRLVDRLRVQNRLRSRETGLTPEHELTQAHEPSADDAFSDRRLLTAALDKLPEGQRRAIELLRLKERSLREASAESGITIGSLKVTVHRALKNLRKIVTTSEKSE